MSTRLKVRLEFDSDFHIGTGAGLGRVVDAVVARTAAGEPVVPGSTLKGLARDAVRGLPDAIRTEEIVSRVFGLPGSVEGVVRFGNAVPEKPYVPPVVHGRSARDRKRGRALDDALFRVEDAGACPMVATVVSDEALGEREMVLLITALRRIEAVGGQRRRGKGRVSVSVEVLESDSAWKGTRVPGSANMFEAALRRALEQSEPERKTKTPVRSAPKALETEDGEPHTTNGSAWAVLWVLARADAPLVLSAAPEVGNTTRTLPHVTGTSLRGAIARSLLRRDWVPDDPRFQAAFVREQAHFGPLYPCEAWTGERSFPLPFGGGQELIHLRRLR